MEKGACHQLFTNYSTFGNIFGTRGLFQRQPYTIRTFRANLFSAIMMSICAICGGWLWRAALNRCSIYDPFLLFDVVSPTAALKSRYTTYSYCISGLGGHCGYPPGMSVCWPTGLRREVAVKDPFREQCLFRSADSLFKGQANETLIGNTCAGGAFAYSVVKLAGQTQVD